MISLIYYHSLCKYSIIQLTQEKFRISQFNSSILKSVHPLLIIKILTINILINTKKRADIYEYCIMIIVTLIYINSYFYKVYDFYYYYPYSLKYT